MATNIVFNLVGAVTSQWYTLNWMGDSPMNVSVAVENVSGTNSYVVEYTYDDPNALQAGVTTPLAFSTYTPKALGGSAVAGVPPAVPVAATGDGLFNFPFVAIRVNNSAGTGTLRVRIIQAGIG